MNNTHTVNDDKMDLLKSWEKYCAEKVDADFDTPEKHNEPEFNYHLGAYHAFRDAIDTLEADWKDEEEPLNKAALVFGAAVTVGAGYLAWKKREVIKAYYRKWAHQ